MTAETHSILDWIFEDHSVYNQMVKSSDFAEFVVRLKLIGKTSTKEGVSIENERVEVSEVEEQMRYCKGLMNVDF